jgi:hypothetical protein
MENASFCYLFHEITLSTLWDIKDFVSQSHGAKFQTAKNFYEPNMQMYSWHQFRRMTKYILSHPISLFYIW